LCCLAEVLNSCPELFRSAWRLSCRKCSQEPRCLIDKIKHDLGKKVRRMRLTKKPGRSNRVQQRKGGKVEVAMFGIFKRGRELGKNSALFDHLHSNDAAARQKLPAHRFLDLKTATQQ
jgi:hypothetical protein